MKRLAVLFALCASPLHAGSSDLRALMTGDDTRGWEAVGRLNIAGKAFCTGSLISETLVLTAAHCLYDADTGEAFDPTSIEFLAGWRDGRAAAYRGVRRAVIHPDYDFDGPDKAARVASDIAILELDQPIRTTAVVPFATTGWPAPGDEVGVVSYAHDRAEAPSIQETCSVIARQQDALITDCDVDRGSSGAPVFVFRDGRAQIASVISAKASADGAPVSLGAGLGALAALTAQLAVTDGHFTSVSGALPTVNRGGSGASASAKFVRPGE